MKTVYVDSSAWIALIRKSDRDHQRVAKAMKTFRIQGASFVTTESVVTETASRLLYDCGVVLVKTFGAFLDRSIHTRSLSIFETNQHDRRVAFESMVQYSDLGLSYCDAIGARVAKQVSATCVFSLDNDFRVLGFDVVP